MNHILKRSLHCSAVSLVAISAFSPMVALAQFPVFKQTNLVSNDATANPAQVIDPLLKNAWGVSYGPSGPWWISNNGSGTSTLYSTNSVTNATNKIGLTVTIPGNGSVTGQVFNSNTAGTPNFNSDNFLFVSEDGTVSGGAGH